jgi:hypothetical protein
VRRWVCTLAAVACAATGACTPIALAARLPPVHRCRGLAGGLYAPVRERGTTCRVARHILAAFLGPPHRGRWRQTAVNGQRSGPGTAICVLRRHPVRVFASAQLNS